MIFLQYDGLMNARALDFARFLPRNNRECVTALAPCSWPREIGVQRYKRQSVLESAHGHDQRYIVRRSGTLQNPVLDRALKDVAKQAMSFEVAMDEDDRFDIMNAEIFNWQQR
jgi:hypothetical protein